MRLKQLKLSGFKSFVDPTTISFASQLMAVVGPNGCGKSNIMDAVRWVVGESAAKNLRGESMIDVIFNGSATRKPLSQTSVELVFDNCLGRLAGPYASYQEIAVKRILTRGGDSTYLLNGTPCRRRDIIDLLLGTGAGARGYSMIGQGTISRIIEAKPEELRLFIEEAAGVSKYKDRRRETLSRIEQTRQNLERINDIGLELEKQLQRIERQARAAKRYQELKEEERQGKLSILAFKWKMLTAEEENVQLALQNLKLNISAQEANLTQAYQQSVETREMVRQAMDELQEAQAQFYQLTTDIALGREAQEQKQREQQRLAHEKKQWENALANNLLLQEQEKNIVVNVSQKQKELEDLQRDQQAQLRVHISQLTLHEQQQLQWQSVWDCLHTEQSRILRVKEISALTLKNLNQRRHELHLRIEKLQGQVENIRLQSLDLDSQCHPNSLPPLQEEIARMEQQRAVVLIHQTQYREQLKQLDKEKSQIEAEYRQLLNKEVTLKAQRNTCLQLHSIHENEQVKDYVYQLIQVDEPWRQACEWVLEANLQAQIVSEICLPATGEKALYWTTAQIHSSSSRYPCLASTIKGIKPVSLIDLHAIFLADSLEDAWKLVPSLNEGESLITPDCWWIGKGWIRFRGQALERLSLLSLHEDLLATARQLVDNGQEQEQIIEKQAALHKRIEQVEDEGEQLRQQLQDTQEQFNRISLELVQHQKMKAQLDQQKIQAEYELEDCLISLNELSQNQEQTEIDHNQASTALLGFEHQQQQLLDEKRAWEAALTDEKKLVTAVQTQLHQLDLQRERHQAQLNHSAVTLKRIHEEQATHQLMLEAVDAALKNLQNPEPESLQELSAKVEYHAQLEQDLIILRERVNDFTNRFEAYEASIKRYNQEIKQLEEQLKAQQLHQQALMLQSENILASLANFNADLSFLLGIEIIGEVSAQEQKLQEISRKIAALGAINLAAIEEHQVESERKNYLDAQCQDLNQALGTLESAIKKIDAETAQRVEETFNAVNQSFMRLFPKLFGGGQASLRLSSDNLLDAGVLIMAQPPGKRNSSIHLLSGGEKALTAVALIFAIFELNPSPFCLLDEVDAPLDEVNIGRFCALVKEMSHSVQFIFITHNKITMELADYLIGVTMRELGVSRIVAVDVEQALSMVEMPV